MSRKVVGSLVNKLEFSIDSKSWNNLTKFQGKLRKIKEQMTQLNGGINIKSGSFGKLVAVEDKLSKARSVNIERETAQRIKAEETIAKKQAATDKMRDDRHARAIAENNSRDRRSSNTRLAEVGLAAGVAVRMNETSDMSKASMAEQFRRIELQPLSGKAKASILQLRQEADELHAAFLKGSISQRTYGRSLSIVASRARTASSEHVTLSRRIMDLRHNLTGLGAIGGGLLAVNDIMKTGQAFESMGARMLMATGGSKQAGEAFELARFQSERLGLDLLSTADSFARLGIAAEGKMTKKATDELFTSFVELGSAAQLPEEQMKRGMRAMEQMLNKGSLMSEEVKGQFAEAIPGGLKLFSDSLGMTEKEFFKAMESGTLLSADVMPKLAKTMSLAARKGGALEASMRSNRAAMNRMITQWQLFKKAIFDAGVGDLLTGMFDAAGDLLVALKPVAILVTGLLTEAFQGLTLPIRMIIAGIADIIELFGGDFNMNTARTTAYVIGLAGGVMMLVKAFAALKAIATAGIVMKVLGLAAGALAGAGAAPILLGVGAAVAGAGAMTYGYQYLRDRHKDSYSSSNLKKNEKVMVEGTITDTNGVMGMKVKNAVDTEMSSWTDKFSSAIGFD